MSKNIKRYQRIAGLDLVRCFAILFVITGHFFINSGFNKTPFSGIDMFLLGMGQTLFLINVPLFLILTGYLNLNKKINKNYYKGGLRVIVAYLIISLITIAYRIYFLGEHLYVIQWILKITDFSAIPYGWYVEMWIGLFLLTPFLNILWHGIESKKHRIILIITLYVLTALPDFCNRYGISLVPGFWMTIYPVSFFYIGAYIREYQPSPNKLNLWISILGLCLINPLVNLVFAQGHTFIHIIGDGKGIVAMPLAALWFVAFYKVDVSHVVSKKILQYISLYSLEIYLVSWIFDNMLYPSLENDLVSVGGLLLAFICITPIVFVCSTISGIAVGEIIGKFIPRKGRKI